MNDFPTAKYKIPSAMLPKYKIYTLEMSSYSFVFTVLVSYLCIQALTSAGEFVQNASTSFIQKEFFNARNLSKIPGLTSFWYLHLSAKVDVTTQSSPYEGNSTTPPNNAYSECNGTNADWICEFDEYCSLDSGYCMPQWW